MAKIYCIGVWCRADTTLESLEKFAFDTLITNNIPWESVKAMSSIDIKEDEKCMVDFAKKHNIIYSTFSDDQLNKVDGNFNGSEVVKNCTGVDNVCERSAVKMYAGKIVVPKVKSECHGMTLAVAVSDER